MANNNKTVEELKQECRDKGLKGYSKLNKKDFLKLLSY